MSKTVAIGAHNFEELQAKDYFYIDKTNFIKEWWESGDIVTLITRPRRFGKTLNMSMVEQFFSIHYEGRGELFQELSMNEYMNDVAVQIFSSFDTGTHPSQKQQPERFYHGFVLGLLVELRDRYLLTSNQESGFGRYDVI